MAEGGSASGTSDRDERARLLQEAREHFIDLVDRTSAEQSRALRRLRDQRPQLAAVLQDLLSGDRSGSGDLDVPAAELAAGALREVTPRPALESGEQLGPWTISELIGSGGMSQVYRAQRNEGGFDQQVAIKVLYGRGASVELARRLRTERQILANLDHENICRILDGGETSEGAPYLVMELVEGQSLDEHLRSNPELGLEGRLALFLQICEAVSHAHGRLIVHRDLKPSNIAVTPEGRVKLLDFGIAKLLDDDLSSDKTRTGMFLLTLQYAAPEQIRGEAITTATDVYALGLILYELLSGARPYDLSNKTPAQVEDLVCERAPTSPSTAPANAFLKADSVRSAMSELGRNRRYDLDLITQKALRKVPGNRYASVSDLREDVQRFLDGQPIRARPSSALYRTSRFIGRHRLPVAIAGVALAGLLALTVALFFQREQARSERNRAEQESRTARRTADFLVGIFDASSPYAREIGEREPTASELLERGVAETTALDAEPLLQAEMLGAMSRAYVALGDWRRAFDLSEQALALYAEQAPGSLEHAVALGYHGKAQWRLEQFADSAQSYRQALELLDRLDDFGDADPEVRADMQLDFALSLVELNEEEEARDMVRTALEVYERLSPRRAAKEAAAQGRFADIENHASQTEASLGHTEARIAKLREALLQGDPESSATLLQSRLASALNNRAFLQRDLGDYDAAEEGYREAIEIQTEILGEEHPLTLNYLNNLAVLLGRRGRYSEAAPLLEQVYTTRREVLGPHHPSVASSLSTLAVLAEVQGDLELSLERRREALEMLSASLGEDHISVAEAHGLVGDLLAKMGRLDEAERYVRRGLQTERRVLGDEHPAVATSIMALGLVQHRQGQLAAAEASMREAMVLRQRLLPEGHPQIASGLKALGEVLAERGQLSAAAEELSAACSLYDRLGAGRPLNGDCYVALARVERARGQSAEATRLLRQALEIREEQLPEGHALLMEVRELLAE